MGGGRYYNWVKPTWVRLGVGEKEGFVGNLPPAPNIHGKCVTMSRQKSKGAVSMLFLRSHLLILFKSAGTNANFLLICTIQCLWLHPINRELAPNVLF